jgi:hypothetical protein
MYEKLKQIITDETFYLVIVVLLVGVGSFLLGRQSVNVSTPQTAVSRVSLLASPAKAVSSDTVTIQSPTPLDNIVTDSAGVAKNYVASKSGTRYYTLTCSGASRIKEENKIYFSSSAAAKAAGYTPALNCPGL